MIEIELPMRLRSLANLRESRWKSAARAKKQRQAAALMVANCKLEGLVPDPPWCVLITRIGKRRMDGDNMRISCKHVRDGIADALGVDDADPAIHWSYCQLIEKRYAVVIVISGRAN